MKRIAILVVFILLNSDSPRLLLAADDHRWEETVSVTLNGKWIITEIETPLGNIYQENEPITLIEGKVSGEHANYRLYNDGRSIDWIVADEVVTHTLPGIYRRRGDVLDIYMNVARGERPTEYAIGQARGVFHLTLRRCR
jgi:hypothetical protein